MAARNSLRNKELRRDARDTERRKQERRRIADRVKKAGKGY